MGPLANRAMTTYLDQNSSKANNLSFDIDEYFNLRSNTQKTQGTMVLNSDDISSSFQKLQSKPRNYILFNVCSGVSADAGEL